MKNDTESKAMEEIKEFFESLFTIAGFLPEQVVVREDATGVFLVDANLPEAGILIGENGIHLVSWEQVLKAKAAKIFGRSTQVIVDINNYRAQKDSGLKETAKKAARRATLTKKPVALPAMSAYERKVVHLELALRPDVTTESEGEEPNRRVVVKPL